MNRIFDRSPLPINHPAGINTQVPRLYGARVMMRPLTNNDFESWSEVRLRNSQWLTVWEPQIVDQRADPATNRDTFERRCLTRDRDRLSGTACALGLFVNNNFVGEINVINIVRGALHSGTIGYWIDRNHAGNSYVAEGLVVVAKFAFEQLNLHRLEICIIPRNDRSKRVMEKLDFRLEGLAQRLLEINGVWEDHLRYAVTVEEWHDRRESLTSTWLVGTKKI